MSAADNYVVVWLTTTHEQPHDAWDPIVARAEVAGYSVATTPVMCVADAPAELVGDDDPDGLPVYFATRAEADTFVKLWSEPVTAVVDDVHLSCDWG